MGIEPTLSAWEAEVLPLNYTRVQKTGDRGLMTDFNGLLRNALYPFSVGGKDTRICSFAKLLVEKSSTIFFTKICRSRSGSVLA